jgi:hypothetical protein
MKSQEEEEEGKGERGRHILYSHFNKISKYKIKMNIKIHKHKTIKPSLRGWRRQCVLLAAL